MKFLIIGINYVLRLIVISVIMWVRCSTESTQMVYITDMVFVCQLFNTGFLLMLCNANMKQQGSFLFRHGKIPDFNTIWFTQLGEIIVGSMVFNSVFPIMMEAGMFALRTLFRAKDKCCASGNNSTQCITIQQFINLHAGP